jgi:hypothetical protein
MPQSAGSVLCSFLLNLLAHWPPALGTKPTELLQYNFTFLSLFVLECTYLLIFFPLFHYSCFFVSDC